MGTCDETEGHAPALNFPVTTGDPALGIDLQFDRRLFLNTDPQDRRERRGRGGSGMGRHDEPCQSGGTGNSNTRPSYYLCCPPFFHGLRLLGRHQDALEEKRASLSTCTRECVVSE